MIQIHRYEPVIRRNGKTVNLTKIEHELLIALGMMDNKLVSQDLLSDVIYAENKNVLLLRLTRLRKKIGTKSLKCVRGIGYILTGDVQFYG